MATKKQTQQAQEKEEEPNFIESSTVMSTRKRPLKKDYGKRFYCRNCGSYEILEIYTIEEVIRKPSPKIFGEKAKTPLPFERKNIKKYRCDDCKIENPDLELVADRREEESYFENDCFIATAVYGDENAPQVKTLRDFRDNVLKQSAAGDAVVNFYYSGAGKKAANFIKTHLPSSIQFIRKGLDFLVEKHSKN